MSKVEKKDGKLAGGQKDNYLLLATIYCKRKTQHGNNFRNYKRNFAGTSKFL